jgi:hypothetical protein
MAGRVSPGRFDRKAEGCIMQNPRRSKRKSGGCIMQNLRTAAGYLAAAAAFVLSIQAFSAPGPRISPMRLESASIRVFAPLDSVTVLDAPGTVVSVLDAKGREYARIPSGAIVRFAAGGAAGTHSVRALDPKGAVRSSLAFVLEPRTRIEDGGGRMRELLEILKGSMNAAGGAESIQWNGKTYHYFVSWLRDHVHTMKGMKYFEGTGAEAVDLYRESQRPDGMIWDFVTRGGLPNFNDTSYKPLGYSTRLGNVQFTRMPLEADVEYLFVEGIYYAWKQNGDDAWMAKQLDAAIRAMDYSMTDPARWSSKFGLVKRGYTIDTWDFAVDDPTTQGLFQRWHTLLVDPARTKFGVMFGDNTGYAASCGTLAEMLTRCGRMEDAERFRIRGEDVRRRLDAIAWNGAFFRHRVEEDPALRHDLGVDEASQVSLSNAYSLNRGIRHDQAAAIVRTYQKLREGLPPGCPGEWFGIYPPFGEGFGDHSALWQYINGAVSPIIAGELAHGAFEHGFEAYGADILMRVLDLGRKHDGRVYFSYTGAFPEPAAPSYTAVDISRHATMALGGKVTKGTPNWMVTLPDDNLDSLPTGRQDFGGVPFLVPNPSANSGRGAVAVSSRKGFPRSVEIPLNAKASSIVLLHTAGEVTATNVAGAVALVYDDGTEWSHYLIRYKNVFHWWYPSQSPARDGWGDYYGAPRTPPLVRLAWRGANAACPNVGLHWYAFDNPHPEKRIRKIVIRAAEDGAIYAVLGLTLSDRPVYVRPGDISFGGPDNWAAAAVTYALVEGLTGVVDTDRAFETVRISPRWPAAAIDSAAITVHYPASGGYAAYTYEHDPDRHKITLRLTGSGTSASGHVLLPPAAARVMSVQMDGKAVPFSESALESSRYADFNLPLPGPETVRIFYATDK